MTTYVCPIKDIECGDHKVGWCNECPKHGKQAYVYRGPEPDCRTCVNYGRNYYENATCTLAYDPCKSAHRYKALPPVRLWSTK
jgi:hypothetical protein